MDTTETTLLPTIPPTDQVIIDKDKKVQDVLEQLGLNRPKYKATKRFTILDGIPFIGKLSD